MNSTRGVEGRPSYEVGRVAETTPWTDHYLGARLGSGGFRRSVSLFTPGPATVGDAEANERFASAAARFASTSHPGLLPVEDVAEAAGRLFAVSAPFAGAPLRHVLGAPAARAAKLGARLACYVVVNVADAVVALTERGGGSAFLGAISGDTVWITEPGRPVLMPTAACSNGLCAGTEESGAARYVAPELAEPEQHGDRADVYSLGLLLWDLLVLGRRTLQGALGAETSAATGATDPGLVRLVMQSLSARPLDRPASVAEFRRELLVASPGARDAGAGLPAALRSTPPGPRSIRYARRPSAVPSPERSESEPSEELPTVDIETIEVVPTEPVLERMSAPIRTLGHLCEPISARTRMGFPLPKRSALGALETSNGGGPRRAPRLRLESGDAASRALAFDGASGRWVVGRALSSDLVLYDPDASREHFAIVRDARGSYRVYDLGSKNGLFINGAGAPGDGFTLKNGDEVRAGATLFRFED